MKKANEREILSHSFLIANQKRAEVNSFLGSNKRGLHDIELLVSDHHNGLIQAIRQHF